MTLNEIKMKRVLKALGSKIPQPVQEDVGFDEIEEGSGTKAKVKKKPRALAFMKHCVSTITGKSDKAAGPAKQAQAEKPLIMLTDYEKALKKLREDHRQNTPNRNRVVFETTSAANLKKQDRSRIVYRPRG